MRKSTFKELCTTIRQAWTQKDGVIVRFNNGPEGNRELLLCVGGHRNPDFVARQCVVWEGDTKVYDGSLLSEDLRELITSRHVCLGELTNAKLLEHERRGLFKCFLCPDKCTKKCSLKRKKFARTAKEVSLVVQ